EHPATLLALAAVAPAARTAAAGSAVLGAELLVDLHQLAALLGREQRADREHRAQALLLELGLRAADLVGLREHRGRIGGVGREQRVHLVVQGVERFALRLALLAAGLGQRADPLARRGVEVQAFGVALEDALDAGTVRPVGSGAGARLRGAGARPEYERGRGERGPPDSPRTAPSLLHRLTPSPSIRRSSIAS